MVFESLNVSLAASETISKSLRSIANAAELAGDQAVQSSVEFGSYGEALEQVSDEAMELAFTSTAAAEAVDEAGDEALSSAAKHKVLDAAMDDASDSSLDLVGSLGPVRGRLRTVAVLAGLASPAVAGLATSLGGLATAAGAAGGGLGALAFSGLTREAERMAAASSELEDRGEAMEQIFANWGDAMRDALDPLQTVASTELAFAGMGGLVELTEMFAESVASTEPTLTAIAEVWGSSVMENAPAIMSEIATTVRALAPEMEEWAGIMEAIPPAIAFLRSEAVQLAPILGEVTMSFFRMGAALGDVGTDLMTVVLPSLAGLFNVLASVFGVLASIPQPVFAAATAMGVLTAIMVAYGSVTAFASAVTTALLSPLIAVAGAIGTVGAVAIALTGILVGVISYFGWWNAIIDAAVTTWNMAVGAIQWWINSLFMLYDALGPLGPMLFPALAVIENFDAIVQALGGSLKWLAGIAVAVASTIVEVFKTVGDVLRTVLEGFGMASEMLGLSGGGGGPPSVDLSGAKMNTSSGGGSSGRDGGPRPPRESSTQKKEQKTENNYDFSNADFSGNDGSEVQRKVEEAVKRANQEDRAREDANRFD